MFPPSRRSREGDSGGNRNASRRRHSPPSTPRRCRRTPPGRSLRGPRWWRGPPVVVLLALHGCCLTRAPPSSSSSSPPLPASNPDHPCVMPFATSRGWFVRAGLGGALGFQPPWGLGAGSASASGKWGFPGGRCCGEGELEVGIPSRLSAHSWDLPGIRGLEVSRASLLPELATFGEVIEIPHSSRTASQPSALYGGAGDSIGLVPSSLLWLARTSVCGTLHMRKHRKVLATAGHNDVHRRSFSPWRLGHDAHPAAEYLLHVCIV
jgi:hypothetical protein